MSITVVFIHPTALQVSRTMAAGKMRWFNDSLKWPNKSNLMQFITEQTEIVTEIFMFLSQDDVGEVRQSNDTRDGTEIQLIPFERADIHSLDPKRQQANEEIQQNFSITNITNQSFERIIRYRGEELIPHALLPSNEGIEMRGESSVEYKAASPEYVREVTEARKKRKSDIVHCKKLLELPEGSRQADPEIHWLGW